MIRARWRTAAFSVASEIGANDRELIRKQRSHLSPHQVRLRKAVQQKKRRTGAEPPQKDRGFLHSNLRRLKSIETCHDAPEPADVPDMAVNVRTGEPLHGGRVRPCP